MTIKRRYFESPVVTAAPGWSSHAFDFTARQWKSAESEWQFTEAPGVLPVVQLDVLVYENTPASLYVVYMSPPQEASLEPEPAPEPQAAPLQPAAPERRPIAAAPRRQPAARSEQPSAEILSQRDEKRLGRKLTPEDRAEILRVLQMLED